MAKEFVALTARSSSSRQTTSPTVTCKVRQASAWCTQRKAARLQSDPLLLRGKWRECSHSGGAADELGTSPGPCIPPGPHLTPPGRGCFSVDTRQCQTLNPESNSDLRFSQLLSQRQEGGRLKAPRLASFLCSRHAGSEYKIHGREERPGVASDTALEPAPPDISFKMSSPSTAPAASSLLEAGGDPGGCRRGAFLTHCSETVTLRDTARLGTWDQDSPQVGRKSLGPLRRRNEGCG